MTKIQTTQQDLMKQLQERQSLMKNSREIQQAVKKSILIVGNQSRYQSILIVFLSFCFFLATYQFASASFYFMNPNFQCQGVPTLQEEACRNLTKCTITNDYTITAENGLFCYRKGDRNLIQFLFGIGSMMGVLFVNFISDYNGRKTSIVISISSQIVSMVLLVVGAHFDIVALMGISQILIGFSAGSFLSVSYVYTDKVMSKKWADRTTLLTNGFGSLALLTIILFASFSTWRVLAIYVVMIPSIIILIFGVYFLSQDPILLFTKQNYVECQKSLAKIAKINNKTDKLTESLKALQQIKQKQKTVHNDSNSILKKIAYLKLLGSKKILIPIVLLGTHQFGGNLFYYSINYATSQVGTSYGLDMVFFGIAQFTGVFPLMFIGSKVPRKLGLIIAISTVIAISLLFFLDIPQLLQTLLLGLMKFILTSQYVLYIYLSVQTLPQHIQSTAFGIIQLMGQSGKLVAPFSINLANQLQRSPIAVMGILFIVLSLTPLFFLNQTLRMGNKGEVASEKEQNKTVLKNEYQVIEQQNKRQVQQGLLIQ